LLLFGSSAAGKTSALNVLRERSLDLAIHDFDEIGVPPAADTAWRHRANEEWVRKALDYQGQGTDLLLAAQTPFGELLATPSAARLDGIAACLLDCDDETRIARLDGRGRDWFARSGGDIDAYLNWAAWMRRHARDPTWRIDVIRHNDTEAEMRWARWAEWQVGDPRWRVHVIDTSTSTIPEAADQLLAWMGDERASQRNRHPLGQV
jgi:hypothetical protein